MSEQAGHSSGRFGFEAALNRALDLLVALLLTGAAVVVCANVFSRYVMAKSLFGSEDFTLLLLLWMTFIAAIVVQSDEQHFSMSLLKEALPARGQWWLALFVELACCVTLGILAFSSLGLLEAYATSTQISLGIPKRVYAYPVVIGSFGMLLVVVLRLLRRWIPA